MACLELDLLGGFQARAIGSTIEIAGRKERALLAVLALPPGEPLARAKLAALLWSDRGEKQAHDSLKSAIARLKKAFDFFEIHPIVSSREFLALKRDELAVDVATFERLVSEKSTESLAAATALYRGDLLDGLDISDRAFEEWLLLERQRLRVLARDALAELLDQYVASRNRDGAVATAHRLLRLDPVRESAHRALMRLYAEQGQPTLAMKQYRNCCDALRSELGVAPEAETVALYRSIQEGRSAIGHLVDQSSARAADMAGHADPPSVPDAAALVKPVIAVLPFENLNGDPAQRYFSDGITEDIITELARNHGLFVIARNSSFQYRNQASDVKRIARDLGAHYIVEGSVRRMGQRIRIAAQLVDAGSGSHLWAERFDRDLKALFDIQDEVVRAIVAAISGQVEAAGIEKVRRKRTDSLAAYDCFLRGLEHFHRSGSEDTIPGRDFFVRAIEIDPDFARAHALLAGTLIEVFWVKLWSDREGANETLALALQAAQRAVTLDNNDSLCHWSLGYVHYARKALDLAAHHFDLATKLNPNDAEVIARCGLLEVFTGKPEQALRLVAQARALDPHQPNFYYDVEGLALYQLRRYEEAIRAFECATAKQPYSHRYLAASYAQAGRMAEARAAADRSLALQPKFTLRVWSEWEPYQSQADLDHMREGMRRAGLPD